MVWFTESNVVHMGDLHFEGRFPFVDLDTGGTVQGAIASIEAILAQVPADTKFLSGHGGPINTADVVRRDLAMIKATAEIAQGWHARGLTLEAAQAEGLPEEYAKYSWNFIPTERGSRPCTRTTHTRFRRKPPCHMQCGYTRPVAPRC